MKRVLVGIAIAILASGLLASALSDSQPLAVVGLLPRGVAVTIASVLIVFGLLILMAAASRRGNTAAVVRLDHFLPFLRKKKKNETLRPPSAFARVAQRVLPASLFDDRLTGKPGLARRSLKWIGPTALSSPMRRIVQTVCFLAFLWLFFYVLWPYDAQPQASPEVSAGWRVEAIEPQTGHLQLSGTDALSWDAQPGQSVHLADERAADLLRGDAGEFKIIDIAAHKVTLASTAPLSDEQIDGFLTGGGSWSLLAQSPWPSHYADNLAAKETLPADTFLVIDPLVSLSTAIAARSWVWSLVCAAIILIVCVLIPRGFCGYLCPLGTLIDLFDWTVSKRVKRFRVPDDGWWVHVKYYLLAGTLVCAVLGVLVSGYVAAIPVITRGMLFLGDPVQSGMMRGWHQVPPLNAGHFLSIALFFGVLALGLLKPRFWCKYVCPSGAVFSLGNLFRVTERKVESTCINCNKCVEICPFDAIKPDFTTRTTDCTLCQTCAGVCPTHAIKFVERWNTVELKATNDPPTGETVLGRRGFMSLAAGTAAAVVGGTTLAIVTKTFGARLDESAYGLFVRPPGSVPEPEFLQMCIRCGECFKACPYNVLQPMSFMQQGLEGLWTPYVVADHAGCAPSCNACGEVCPTGAIRALPLEEKRVARMGLAIVNEKTCLPFVNREACQLCVDECASAGYHAIEFTRVHTKIDDNGQPIEGSGHLAPVVLADKCVGCGLCQMQCYQFNVKQKGLLDLSAIIVEPGEGKEDRLMHGSYVELRRQENRERAAALKRDAGSGDYFVPKADQTAPSEKPAVDESPFGPGAPATEPSDPFGVSPLE
jgi:MauM/NapG family ferredoxin protein